MMLRGLLRQMFRKLRFQMIDDTMCQSKMKEAQPGATSFNEKFYGGMDLCYVGQTFAFKVEKPLKPQLDEFYKEPLNVRILHSMRWSMCATR